MENSSVVPQNLHTELLYDPTILLRICPRELKPYVYIKTCTVMIITALLIIAKKGRQPSVYQWMGR